MTQCPATSTSATFSAFGFQIPNGKDLYDCSTNSNHG